MRQNHRKQNTKATYGEAVTQISPWDTKQCVGECKEVTRLYIDRNEKEIGPRYGNSQRPQPEDHTYSQTHKNKSKT